jgi:hypothetical protein
MDRSRPRPRRGCTRPATPVLLLCIAALSAAGCGASPTAAAERAETAPAAVAPPACTALPHLRRVPVASAAELAAALRDVRPGDLVHLADGRYTGRFSAAVSGTPTAPIALCGERGAVIETGSLSSGGYALVVQGSHWTLQGFTVTRAQQGIRILGGSHNLLRALHVHTIGQEAVNLKAFSSHNVVEDSHIHDTGLHEPRYGEGVYVGSDNGHWCRWTGCEPDGSDWNVVRNNHFGPNVRAEMVDVKEGTTGTRVVGNLFDGRGSPAEARAWVSVFGNDVRVERNRGSVGPLHGFEVVVRVEGWARGARFHANEGDLAGASGYGIRIGSGAAPSAVVGCDNALAGAERGRANVSCTP